MTNPLVDLGRLGQSPWYDFITRDLMRSGALAHVPKPTERDGVYGDPSRASVDLGQLGVERIVQASVDAIRAATRSR